MELKARGTLFGLVGLFSPGAGADPLAVITTTPDLASLAEAVGGREVEVSALVRGPQDPHFVEPRPSFVRRLHDADLFVQNGMDLEVAWAPVLLRRARNPKVAPGGASFVDASVVIAALEVPTAEVDRSMGDVHPYGNPHYLSDPLNGLRVAALLRDKLSELRPKATPGFREGYAGFERRLAEALVGRALVEIHGAETITREAASGSLRRFLDERRQAAEIGGWLARVDRGKHRKAVQDHRLWPYFARRFELELIGTLEPRPGIAPTTRHLVSLIERMQSQAVSLVLATVYFDVRHARWVSERSGARVAQMAHQVGARPDTGDYLSMIDHNVRQITEGP